MYTDRHPPLPRMPTHTRSHALACVVAAAPAADGTTVTGAISSYIPTRRRDTWTDVQTVCIPSTGRTRNGWRACPASAQRVYHSRSLCQMWAMVDPKTRGVKSDPTRPMAKTTSHRSAFSWTCNRGGGGGQEREQVLCTGRGGDGDYMEELGTPPARCGNRFPLLGTSRLRYRAP